MKNCLLAFLFLFSFKVSAQSLETDRLALVAIYNATAYNPVTQRDYFNDITGWAVHGSPGESPCGWTGVTCEAGRVTGLNLSMFQVHGPISPEIGKLTALKYLNLQGGGAEFLPWIGEVPVELGNLINLEYLNLSYNRIGIANMGVIGNLINLKELAVTPLGEIPAEWASLVNLEVLFLGSLEAFGPSQTFAFPEFLTSFTKLRELYLFEQLRGTFPAQIGSIANLEVLEIVLNYGLTGQIPPEIGNLSKLKKLTIMQSRGLNGAIPTEIGNLLNLEELQLGDMPLTGSIPAQINNLIKLTRITIGSTNLGGPFPVIDNLTALSYLDVRYNHFEGPLPSLSNIPVAGYVHLGSNAFTFAGLEENLSKLDGYGNQAKIPMLVQLLPGGSEQAELSVEAGGTLSNNTYKWFKDGLLFATNTGNKSVVVTEEATYRVEVTNSVVTGLKLVSDDYVYIRLPVTLVAFNAKKIGDQNKLTWKTTSETNNKGFEIERSADARTFEKIGFVDGNGDTKEDKTYHFTDLQPFETSYYRLKQLDYDGKFEYSRVISVQGESIALNVYPNPTQEYLTISGIEPGTEVSIINQSGRIVLKSRVNPKQAIAIGGLRVGLYNVLAAGVSKKLLISR